jgi:hypothetical protein
MHTSPSYSQPRWWNNQHESTWERMREAMRRDWEQTKADFTKNKKGADLNQDVDDTVKQAAGKDPIPPRGVPNYDDDWDSIEPAVRYGVGAREYYADYNDWDDELEGKLRTDWESTNTGSSWDKVKMHVRRGWESVKRTLS